MPFLKKIAQKIIDNNSNLSEVKVLVPTRRSALSLKKEIVKLLDHTSWLPEFLTINEWIDSITGLKPADNLTLKFACYNAYVQVMQGDARDISDFFSWADILIKDFNDIEAQRVDRNSFFKNLTEYREIEHFSFLKSPLSEKQMRYKKFWNALPQIQKQFNEDLLNRNMAYAGLNLRRAYEMVSDDHYKFEEKVYVIGFNAFSKCETDILKLYQDRGYAEIYFDTDDYYLNQKENHAGHFIRRNLQNQLGKTISTEVSMAEKSFNVEICEASHHIDQAIVVGGLLGELTPEERRETALVLADESLLIPILDNLPEGFDDFNITMGLSLSDSLFTGWLTSLYDVLFQKLKSDQKEKFPVKKIFDFVSHPFSQLISQNEIKTPLKTYGFVSNEELKESFKNQQNWMSGAIDFWDYRLEERNTALSRLLTSVIEKLSGQENPSIAILQAQKAITLIVRGLAQLDKFTNQHLLSDAQHFQLVKRMIAGGNVDLLSNPEDRLQIMGILETRALAFKRIIVCGANEGMWPAKPNLDSFIPFEIRNFHNLSGKKEKEAVYAYNFYRLFSHAENVQLVYHTDRGTFSGGEKSRYLLQLEYLLKPVNQNMKLTYRHSVSALAKGKTVEKNIDKTPEIINLIKAHLKKGISITSINLYLADPLEWYYNYVIRLEETPKDEIDASLFGIVVHKVLEKLFEPTIGKVLTIEMVESMEKSIDHFVANAISEEKQLSDFETGINKIHFETAKKQVRNYLDSLKIRLEKGNEEITCLKVEDPLARTLSVPLSDGSNFEVKFVGVADKIQRNGNVMEIIDYKTGNTEPRDLNVKSYTPDAMAKVPKAVQLMTYNWMAAKKYGESKITSRIITLRAPLRKLKIEYEQNKKEENQKFENFLIEVLQEMLNPDFPLIKNSAYKYAKFE